MNLNLVRGLPGSGKSTFARTMFRGILHVEADMLSMQKGRYVFDGAKLKQRHATTRSIVELALMEGADVVVANTFTTLEEMRPYIEMAEKHGATLCVYWMMNKFQSEHNVPQEIMEKMAARWEPFTGEIPVKE